MANDKDVRQLPARAAIVASPAPERTRPGSKDGKAQAQGATEPEPAKGTEPAPAAQVPAAPANDLLHQTIVERDQARADGEARKSLAIALTRSLQEVRQQKEHIASRLEAAEEEIGQLRAYRNDLEAARLAANRERARNETELAASHRARAEAESLVGDLRKDVQLLHKQIAALGKERDEALLHRADAVKAALASIRNTILEEL